MLNVLKRKENINKHFTSFLYGAAQMGKGMVSTSQNITKIVQIQQFTSIDSNQHIFCTNFLVDSRALFHSPQIPTELLNMKAQLIQTKPNQSNHYPPQTSTLPPLSQAAFTLF